MEGKADMGGRPEHTGQSIPANWPRPAAAGGRPWLEAALRGAVRQGRPEATDHPSCAYSQLDHDTDEEWHAAFTKYRLCILENVRHIALAAPLLPLGHLDAWLRAVLAEPLPALPELEAISALLDATLSKLAEPEQVQEVAAREAERVAGGPRL